MNSTNTPNMITRHIANNLRAFYTGGNWTGVCLRDSLQGISWEQATTSFLGRNSISVLVYHITYYVRAVINVLQGNLLDAHDKFSFDAPPIRNNEDWDALIIYAFSQAETLATLIENLPDTTLTHDFADAKYGSYFRNLIGVIEHCHYHCGQISILRKLIEQH